MFPTYKQASEYFFNFLLFLKGESSTSNLVGRYIFLELFKKQYFEQVKILFRKLDLHYYFFYLFYIVVSFPKSYNFETKKINKPPIVWPEQDYMYRYKHIYQFSITNIIHKSNLTP